MRSAQTLDILAQYNLSLSLHVDQFDRRFAFAGHHSGHNGPIGGLNVVGSEVSFDASIRIEDMDQQFVLWMDSHTSQFRPDLVPQIAVLVAQSAMLLVDQLAIAPVTLGVSGILPSFHNALSIGVENTAAAFHHRDGFLADLRIGMVTEQLTLVELQIVDAQIPGLNCPDQILSGLGTCKHHSQTSTQKFRRQHLGLFDQ